MNKFAAAAAMAAEVAPVVSGRPVVAGRTVHIDGDYLAYYHGFPDIDGGLARENVLGFIEAAKRMSGAEKAVVHLTDSASHKGERYLIATVKPYQEKRSPDKEIKNRKLIREYIQSYSGTAFIGKTWITREADDGMAACAHYAAKKGALDAILTKDKDMRMFPGLHMCWDNFDILTEVPLGAYEVWGEDAVGKDLLFGTKWFLSQMLHGDTTDNIPGLPEFRGKKVGPAAAKTILSAASSEEDAFTITYEAYLESYGSDEEGADRFCEQAALLWMRHDLAAEVASFALYFQKYLDNTLREAVDRLEERVRWGRVKLTEMELQ